MIEEKIASIAMKIFREFDYILTSEEIGSVLAYVKRKAEGVYDPWSAPYLVLVEDEFRSYVFRNRITELTCSAID